MLCSKRPAIRRTDHKEGAFTPPHRRHYVPIVHIKRNWSLNVVRMEILPQQFRAICSHPRQRCGQTFDLLVTCQHVFPHLASACTQMSRTRCLARMELLLHLDHTGLQVYVLLLDFELCLFCIKGFLVLA